LEALLVHEWLTNLAGSEKVVGALRRALPGAPVYTSMFWAPEFPGWDDVRTSFLQPLARGPSSHVPALPAMPAAFASLRLPPAELMITSFHSFSLWARPRPGTPHLVYCHTPPRFIWSSDQLRGESGLMGGRVLRSAGAAFRRLDRGRARRPTMFVANSAAVAQRIQRAYGRPAEVVHPPVELDRFAAAASSAQAGARAGDYFLVVSRLVPYKQVDLAVDAFGELGLPLWVVGTGRSAGELAARAGPNVRFLGRVSDEALPGLMAGARAMIMPGEEDFGLTVVEAMAAGTPVIALGRGGAAETVTDGVTGVLFAEETVASLSQAVGRAAAIDWDRPAISASTQRFGEARFRAAILALAADLAGGAVGP